MKRIIVICGAALIALATTTESGAQNVLGRLADRAKNAAENAVGKKIENAVYNAIDKTMGNKNGARDQQNQTQTQTQTQTQPRQSAAVQSGGYYGGSYDGSATVTESNGETDHIKEFVDGLADIGYRKEGNYNVPEGAKEAYDKLKIKSMEDVVKLIPAFPTPDQIINWDESFNADREIFHAAASDIANGYILATANVLQNPRYQQGSNRSVPSAANRARMDAGAMQIFAAMQKYGIDPEKATEEEMEAFMKKAVANGDIQMPSGKGQAFDMNYTDKMESDIDKISDRISALGESASNLAMENAFYTSTSPLQVTLDSLFNDAVAKWKASDAYKKVYDIEKDIDKRAWDWVCKHPDYHNNGAEIIYPPFWVQGRKQENAVIREYNMVYLNQWIEKLQSALEKPIALLKEAAVLDVELEKTFTDKTDLVYANLKTQLGTSITHISTEIHMFLGFAYRAPVICSAEESKKLSM